MVDLNNTEELKKLDPKDIIGSTQLLPKQFIEAWREIQALSFPPITGITNIVFCGMGASIYGGLVVKALLGPQFPYPVEVVSDYHLPVFVNESSLVVLTSYSGTTEEVLSCAKEAISKKAKTVVLTKGGPLAEFARTNNVPAYIFDGKWNPASVPRVGNGYTILGLIGLLHKVGIVKVDEAQIQKAVDFLSGQVERIQERAKKDAHGLIGKTPVIFAAEHLAGNAQIMRNQFNETSKTFSSFFIVPDLNHHLLEGLQFPVPSDLVVIFLNANLYTPKIKARMALTAEIVKKNNHDVMIFETTGGTKYEDFMETALYSSYVTLYLGLLYGQDPAINPWVDYIKEELAKIG